MNSVWVDGKSVFETEVIGQITAPAIVVIGTWDPFNKSRFDLVQNMTTYAQDFSGNTVAVMLDPSPVKYLPGKWNWPSFEDPVVRIKRLLDLGVDAVIRVNFEEHHIHLGAAEILGTIMNLVPIKELWIGARQQFGRGEKGGKNSILTLGEEWGFEVKILDPLPLPTPDGPGIVELLQSGRVVEAREIVGHAPTFAAPSTETPLTLCWPPGLYKAIPLPSVDTPLESGANEIVVKLISTDDDGHSQMVWPDTDQPYIAIIRGPNDSE